MTQLASRPFKKARSVNSSSGSFPTWASVEVNPPFLDAGTAAGRVVERVAIPGGNGLVPRALVLMPYGLSANNDTFDLQVVGYRRVLPQLASGRDFYVRQVLANLSCTMGNTTGLASAGGDTYPVLNTEFFCDTIVVNKEGTFTAATTREGTVYLYSPANDTPGFVIVPLLGVEAWELEFDQTLNSPTMNALVSYIDAPSKQP